LPKRKKQVQKFSFLVKVFRFFFPKDWKASFQKGKEIGSASGIAKKVGGKVFDAGKTARKRVDPEHKMKIGNQRKKK